MYPNTHCSGIGKSKALQWVLSDATVVVARMYKGSPCVHGIYSRGGLIGDDFNKYEIFLDIIADLDC